MTFQEFNVFFSDFTSECYDVCATKGIEYAHSEDKFANFNRLAERLSLDRLTVASVYLGKHLDAIDSYIKTKTIYSNESIHGRIVDSVNYLILIAAMIDETLNNVS